ncbi:MAG: hypothetical protein K1Y36_13780 [Blastocatellia bacterium]|nr:hypothetical protein [Blastocatellia bacterium]
MRCVTRRLVMFNSHLPPLERIIWGTQIGLLVVGRAELRTLSPLVPFVVISITDPDKPDAEIIPSDFLNGVLRLKFDDAEGTEIGHPAHILMSMQDAHLVLAFVESHLAAVQLIVCQCEAGVSRSAGVAAALANILHGEDQFFFDHYWPNRLVYRLLVTQGGFLHTKKCEPEQTGSR